MSFMPGDHTRILQSMGRVSSRRLFCLSAKWPRDRAASRIRLDPWILIPILFCVLASSASGESENWLIARNDLAHIYSLGELDEITVDRVNLSFVDRHSTKDFFTAGRGRPGRNVQEQEYCQMESYLAVMPDLRNLPSWALSEIGDCSPARSSLDGLIPRISIRGTFFSIGYGVELDKESRGLFIDYGPFTLGIGDSPSGATLFNGATFALPRWLPGSWLVSQRIRENLQFDVGIMLPLDTLDIREWRPQVGIGLKLAEW